MTRRKTYSHSHPQNISWLLCSEDFRSCSKMGLLKLALGPQCVGRLMLLLMQELQPAMMKIQLRCSQPNKQHVEKKERKKRKRLMIWRYANICKIILHIGYAHMFDGFFQVCKRLKIILLPTLYATPIRSKRVHCIQEQNHKMSIRWGSMKTQCVSFCVWGFFYMLIVAYKYITISCKIWVERYIAHLTNAVIAKCF